MSQTTSDSAEGLPPEHLEVTFDREDLKRRSIQGGMATLSAQAVKFTLKFGSTVVLARLLSPAEFGLVAMVAPILGFVATFSDIGFGQAVIQRKNITSQQISSLFWINLSISLGLAGILMLAAPLIGRIYKEPRVIGIVIAMANLLVLGTLSLIPMSIMRRNMQFTTLTITDLGNMASGVAASTAAAYLGFGYWSLVLGQTVASVVGTILAFSFTKWLPGRPARDPELKSIVRFGLNLTGVNLATYFSMTADNMIVGVFAGKVSLGLYDRSYNLTVQPLNQAMLPMNQLAVPLLSRLQGDPDFYRRSYLNLLRVTLLLTMPAMLVCVMLSGPVVTTLLGNKWQDAGPLFSWICAGGLVMPLFSSTGWVFITKNRTGKQMRVAATTAIISVLSFAIGIHWGALGVAAVSATSFTLVQTPLMVWTMTRLGPIRVADVLKTFLPFVLSAGLVAIPLYFLRAVSGIVQLTGIGLLAYALFWSCILLMSGYRDFRSLVASMRGFSTLARPRRTNPQVDPSQSP